MNKKAFTLIETIIAVTLTTVVLTAVTGLILMTLRANERNQHTIQATFLAQEGLEAIRYMRDSNWLQNYAWDKGGDLWGEDFHVDQYTPELTLYVTSKACSGVDPCFSLSANPDDAVITMENGYEFERSLTFKVIEGGSTAYLSGVNEVLCTVTWQEGGSDHSVELSTNLSDWQ